MSLAEIALGAGRASASGGRAVTDIITFIEAPWGLSMRLFPIQKVILKTYYGMPLEDKIADLTFTDWRRTTQKQMTEADYMRLLFDEGRSNVREVEAGRERREMVLSIGRRAGKCVVGDTLVLTDQGVFPIREMGDPNGPEVQPLAVGVVQEGSRPSRSAYFYNGGVRDTIRLRSYAGIEIEGTPNHRVKVLHPDGCVRWARLDEVCPGTMLAVNRNTETWTDTPVDVQAHHVSSPRHKAVAQPNVFDARWGLLMGYLVGDGGWTCQNALSITVEHPETRDEVERLFQELCGKSKFTHDKRSARTGVVRMCDKTVRGFMHNLGFDWNCKANTKSTPWVILRSPREVVRAYLQGLFETDGTVSANGRSVSYCSASKQLARETQTLLLNFGVVTRLRVKHNKKYDRDYYEITVLGLRSRHRFSDEIGFRSHKKQDRLSAGLVNPRREGGDTESVPHQRPWVMRLLQSIPKSLGNGPREWRRSTMRACVGNMCKPGSEEDLTYSRIRALIPVARDLNADPEVIQHFEHLLGLDYFYTEVLSVEAGHAPVFDLNVPDGESFVANGLTNHNTTLSACIAAYETYRLISKGDPQGYYGLPSSNNIQLISVATDKDQAGLLYQEVSGHFRNCAFFMPYTANNTQSYARFQSPKDIERYGSYREDPTAKATLKVTFRSCVAKGLRGAGNIVIILDEVAHFTDDGQSSADAVYNAVVPSSAAFSKKDPNDARIPIGGVESKVISISSPLGRQGLFYKLFSTGFQSEKIAEERLCIQAPTWEVNPTVPAGFFEAEYVKDARVFFTEYGAEFSDRTRGWIEEEADLIACVEPTARPRMRAAPRQPHVAGIDVALVGDYSTIAIGHVDEQNRIVVDLVEGIKAGEGDYEDSERLEFTDVAEWIHDFSKRFYISEGVFDQWLGIPLEQALRAKGLQQFKSFKSTPQVNSQMYQNFKDMMFDHRMVLYDWPIPQGQTHCLYINELLELQAEFKSKYVTNVEAPKVSGKHDDHADALVRMVWAASQAMGKGATIAGHRTLPGQKPLGPMSGFALRRKAMQTGSHPDRMSPGTVGADPARFVGGGLGGVVGSPRQQSRGGRGPSRLEGMIVPPWRKGGR